MMQVSGKEGIVENHEQMTPYLQAAKNLCARQHQEFRKPNGKMLRPNPSNSHCRHCPKACTLKLPVEVSESEAICIARNK